MLKTLNHFKDAQKGSDVHSCRLHFEPTIQLLLVLLLPAATSTSRSNGLSWCTNELMLSHFRFTSSWTKPVCTTLQCSQT